jgi:uncharacterized DUF497 family protein
MSEALAFDWDQWNIQKNELKHGVSKAEAESMFFDHRLAIFDDIKHSSKKEFRQIAYGISREKRVLMVAFTIRNKKIRIISARPASQKERGIYHES